MNNTFIFPTNFEISLIENLPSLRNQTISFLSSHDVTDFFAIITMQEPKKSWSNLVTYPNLYSYTEIFL